MNESASRFRKPAKARLDRSLVTAVLFLMLVLISNRPVDAQQNDQWPQWRGPFATGVADNAADPPVSWSETQNIKWKTKLPGLGHSSPVVWNDLVFLTTAIPVGEKFAPIADNRPGSHDNVLVSQKHQYVVMAIERTEGKIVWQKVVNENLPHEGGHNTASLASASPVTDGKHVYASFGSQGIFCLDIKGNVVWEKQLGKMHSKHGHGEGSSPALYQDTLIINWDHEGQSFILALNKTTGDQLWRQDRKEVTSWASPIVVVVEGQPQVILAGTERIRGYDLASGTPIWECGGLSNNVCATPVAADGILIAGSSYDVRAMLAIELAGATGDITGTDQVLWSTTQRTPYVPSPLLYRGKVYFLRHYQGILTQLDARTGAEEIGPFRINGIRDVYASPAAAADRIYITDREGVTIVLSHSEMPRMLSANRLDDRFSASPAIVGKELFLRGEQFLYCLANQE